MNFEIKWNCQSFAKKHFMKHHCLLNDLCFMKMNLYFVFENWDEICILIHTKNLNENNNKYNEILEFLVIFNIKFKSQKRILLETYSANFTVRFN